MKILICGDYSPYARVAQKIADEQSDDILSEVMPYVQQADYAVVNFESTLAPNGSTPIAKCGPNLSCSAESIAVLKRIGFHCVTLANNHILDYGATGLQTTMEQLRQSEIDFVGVGNNLLEAQKPLVKDINGFKLAIINCCEHEFSIASTNEAGANPLDIVDICHQIELARQLADHVLVIIHGGHEHYQLPSPRMQKTYRFFIEAGADAVMNHHQHRYSGYEIYQNKPIFYGLGNFCFDWDNRHHLPWNEGYMVMLDIQSQDVKYQLIPYHQGNEQAQVCLLTNEQQVEFSKRISELNTIIADSTLLNQHWQQWAHSHNKMLLDFAPYTCRTLRYMANRNLLPKFLNAERTATLLNRIDCESHRDVVTYLLKQRLL